jgi:hypothetical protein
MDSGRARVSSGGVRSVACGYWRASVTGVRPRGFNIGLFSMRAVDASFQCTQLVCLGGLTAIPLPVFNSYLQCISFSVL